MESRPPVDSTKVAHLQMNGIKRALCFHKKLKTPYEWNSRGLFDSTKSSKLRMNGIKRALCFHKKLKTPHEWNQEGSLIPQKTQNSV
jgi:hypothetical protein